MITADISSLFPARHRAAADDNATGLRFTDIVRKRRRPLLLVLDRAGGVVYSSLPDGAQLSEQRVVDEAAAQAKVLLGTPELPPDDGDGDSVPAEDQRWSLVVVDSVVYSVRLFPLHGATDDLRHEQYVAVIELIGGAQSEGIDFATIKARFRLSNRELDVLVALMTGTKDKEIARNLGVTVGTVRAYLKSVRAKLGVTSRTAAVNLVHEASGRNTG
jgi:DNA-binding CsgD family transcriptional regulator